MPVYLVSVETEVEAENIIEAIKLIKQELSDISLDNSYSVVDAERQD